MASETIILRDLVVAKLTTVLGESGPVGGVDVKAAMLGLTDETEITTKPVVVVVPQTRVKTRRSRADVDKEFRVQAAYEVRVGPLATGTTGADEPGGAVDGPDEHMEFAEVMADAIELGERLGVYQLTQMLHEPIFIQSRLREHNVFTSVVTFVFRLAV